MTSNIDKAYISLGKGQGNKKMLAEENFDIYVFRNSLVTKPKEKDEWESKLFGKKGKQNRILLMTEEKLKLLIKASNNMFIT